MFFHLSNWTVLNGKRDKLKLQLVKASESGEWSIEIKRKRKIRSENQNDFYWWAFLDALCDYTGDTIPEMDEQSRESEKYKIHNALKERFLKKATVSVTIRNPKNKRQYIRLKEENTTTTLKTDEFERFLESIRVYFGWWGCNLPYPKDPNDPGIQF